MYGKPLFKFSGGSPLFSFGCDFVFELFGSGKKMSQLLPAIEIFLPHIGIGLMILGAGYILHSLHSLDRAHADRLIKTLYTFVSDSDLRPNKNDPEATPLMKTSRHRATYERLESWLAVQGEPYFFSNKESEAKAARCAELLRSYGYVLGTLKIKKELNLERTDDGRLRTRP